MDSEQYANILHYLITKSYSSIKTENEKRVIRKRSSKYIIIKEKLYLKTINDNKPLVIQNSQLCNILKEIHDDAGHQGVKYTTSLIKDRYYWPNYKSTIEEYIKKCERCILNQYSLKKPIQPLKPLPVISRPWYRVGMDLTGPLITSNGFQYILTMVDHFTKWVETRPLRNKETAEVARGIFSIYCSKGAPVQIISDNGKEFTSRLMSQLQEQYSCHLIFSAPYHPQTNGLVESFHKGIKSYLSKTLADKKELWSDYLEQITFSVNIRPRLDTTGFSAFELMHGFRKARIPNEANNIFEIFDGCSHISNLDNSLCDDQVLQEFNQEIEKLQNNIFEQASKNLINSKNKMKRTFDKKLNSQVVSDYQIGDHVLIPNRKRRKGHFEDLWQGPFPIKKANIETVVVKKGNNEQRIKKIQVKPWSYKEKETNNISNAENVFPETIPNESEFIGEAISVNFREEIIEPSDTEDDSEDDIIMSTLNSLKMQIFDSISSNEPLSKMHSELHQRQNLTLKKITEWKNKNFPEAQTLSYFTEKITDVLIKWYQTAKKADVKLWLTTDQDRANALYWGQKSVDYVAKVLLPVVSDIIASRIGKKSNTTNNDNSRIISPLTLTSTMLSTNDIDPRSVQTTNKLIKLSPPVKDLFTNDFEEYCPNWGGYYNSVHLDNTCTIDNIITVLSINITEIFSLIESGEVYVTKDCSELFDMIKSKEFNQAKLWIANKINKSKLKGNRYNFFGSEGPLIEYLACETGSDKYEFSSTCWECCSIEDRTLNLSYLSKFVDNCQETLNNKINASSCRHCRISDNTIHLEISDERFSRLPLVFMLEVGHLRIKDITGINRTININHNNTLTQFRLLGYTIHSCGHFFLHCFINDELYCYDGIKRPKLSKLDTTNLKSSEIINSIFYILISN